GARRVPQAKSVALVTGIENEASLQRKTSCGSRREMDCSDNTALLLNASAMVSMYQQGEKNGRQNAEGSRQKAEGARRLLSAFCFLPFLLASALRTRLVL